MYDVTVIGAGIVGLATALKIKEKKPKLKVAVFEKEDKIAKHQTGNNSGVIHSGVYYKPGSLKAQNCKEGYSKMVEWCKKEGIAHEICGKIIVATKEEELPRLETLYDRGIQNGLKKIKKITKEQIKDYEPYCTGLAGIHVPYTGIIDFKGVCESYVKHIKKNGGELYLSRGVHKIIHKNGNSEIITKSKDGEQTIETKLVVNTGGLQCDRLAAQNIKDLDVRIIPFRGEYVELAKEKHYLVKNLIYPVPDPAFPFLGVHFTRMVFGGIEAGPNAVWAFKREGYKKTDFSLGDVIDALSWKGFRKVMRKYWKMGLMEFYRSYNKNVLLKSLQALIPEVQKKDIVPGGAGVRAQTCFYEGTLADDFIIRENEHIINVLNAPSPAATSSLAIGETVSGLVLKRFK